MCTLKVVCWHFHLGTSKGLARHACRSHVARLPRIMSQFVFQRDSVKAKKGAEHQGKVTSSAPPSKKQKKNPPSILFYVLQDWSEYDTFSIPRRLCVELLGVFYSFFARRNTARTSSFNQGCLLSQTESRTRSYSRLFLCHAPVHKYSLCCYKITHIDGSLEVLMRVAASKRCMLLCKSQNSEGETGGNDHWVYFNHSKRCKAHKPTPLREGKDYEKKDWRRG